MKNKFYIRDAEAGYFAGFDGFDSIDQIEWINDYRQAFFFTEEKGKCYFRQMISLFPNIELVRAV